MSTLFDDAASSLPRAEFSADGRFRYMLRRRWEMDGDPAVFIALNPSTADAEQDDPTVRRMIDFATGWAHPALELVNLYAFRATKPEALKKTAGPTGEFGAERPWRSVNETFIAAACERAAVVVVCWGSWPGPVKDRAATTAAIVKAAGHTPQCLGTTANGQPRHPLYVRGGTPLTDWEAPRG